MAKFLFVYHGGSAPSSPEEAEATMAKWSSWLAAHASDAVDGGHPVGKSYTVSSSGVADNGGANPASGYSLFNAESLEEAIDIAKGCPILDSGGNVEVAQAMDM
ncbi:MAG: hypothetical protein AAFX02_11100 [Pseudomonadota bacterium]